jgi:uncharacterized SAM-binding protein YcdF (DUF218 family)
MRLLHAFRMVGGVGLAVFLLAAYTPLPNLPKRWAEVPARLTPADAIVVLAGSLLDDQVLSESSMRRALHGMVLYRQGLASLLVFSGPPRDNGPAEADVRVELARTLGIPAEALVTETTARTTREEAARMAALLPAKGIKHILLVTSQVHMPRSQRLFEKAGFAVSPAPVEDLPRADKPETRLRLLRQILQESLARVYYRVAGYL